MQKRNIEQHTNTNMVFTREQQLKDALALKLRHAKQLAKNQDAQYKINYPSEAREASQGQYALLTKRIKAEHQERIDKVMKYRETHWK